MDSYTTDEPIYALATPYAPSALAVIRTSGEGTIEKISTVFSRPKSLLKAQTNTMVYGKLIDGDGSVVDEVVLCVYHKGHGYTNEEAVEIMAHGSIFGIKRISSLLEHTGFRPALKGEFSFRAFMHGRIDLTQAEAVEEIIRSKSLTSQEAALSRLEGKLRGTLEEISNRILLILASLEVQLDYAEDEIIEDWIFPESEVSDLISSLKRLVSTYNAGRVHRDGAKVVLAGSANAGKSSLFNLLTKEDRAIVSEIPGTTRDFIEVWCDFGGIPVRLFDTAGLREGEDIVESEGIRRSERLIQDADLVLYLVDPESNETLPEGDERYIVIYSKSDKRKREGLSISSVTGEGIDELLTEAVKRLSVSSSFKDSGVTIDSERQRDAFLKCIEALEAADKDRSASVDIMALYFQSALSAIGTITGEVTNEELLDTLFSRFCVGK